MFFIFGDEKAITFPMAKEMHEHEKWRIFNCDFVKKVAFIANAKCYCWRVELSMGWLMPFLCWRHLNALFQSTHLYTHIDIHPQSLCTPHFVWHMWTSLLTCSLSRSLFKRLLHSFSLITSRQQCRAKLFAPQIVPIKLLNQATERFTVNFHKN